MKKKATNGCTIEQPFRKVEQLQATFEEFRSNFLETLEQLVAKAISCRPVNLWKKIHPVLSLFYIVLKWIRFFTKFLSLKKRVNSKKSILISTAKNVPNFEMLVYSGNKRPPAFFPPPDVRLPI